MAYHGCCVDCCKIDHGNPERHTGNDWLHLWYSSDKLQQHATLAKEPMSEYSTEACLRCTDRFVR